MRKQTLGLIIFSLTLLLAACGEQGDTVTPKSFLAPSWVPAVTSVCEAWDANTTYNGGSTVIYEGQAYEAKWWTRGDNPTQSGQWDVWKTTDACGGGAPAPDPTPDPIPDPTPNPAPSGFVVSEAQYNQMFPNRVPYYSYAGFVGALEAWPAFANTGSDTVKRQEAAAFLANMHHESGGGRYVREINQANWPLYCSRGVGNCNGKLYYGRGPTQLSWDYNYRAAGQALGIDLLNNPDLVADNATIGWQTALWYWMTQRAQAAQTPHDAMVSGAGFGETIRAINGGLECNGNGAPQRNTRIQLYRQFTGILSVPTGNNLGC